ncbi:hypothetical protein [Aquimarina brevivitae]|uniref:Uncharacterized protein n=1 Tax=Aquimarina brevivitae TaxID=323412 RepID=A0A4Q7P226_9FLAO|nr:hypothetical protein [Aquimarina brevivitae]RZS93933.1 hypothetical protein EV197_2514 [Aquimarina brevivitae]
MRILVIYILISTICFGCTDNNSNWSSEKFATIFYGSKIKNEKFRLTFTKTDRSQKYTYVNLIDTTKTFSIKKIMDSNTIFFGFEKFIKTNTKSFKDNKLNSIEFDYYHLEDPVTDGTGPILFNSSYGLLAIKNIFGPTVILLDSKDHNLAERIIDKLK